MFTRLLILMASIAVLSSCEDNAPIKDVSSCINLRIDQFPPMCEEEAETTVDEYYFQNELVYVFDYSTCCCDYSSPVLNASCDTLGYLHGFEGNYTINGEDFSQAEFKRTVWP